MFRARPFFLALVTLAAISCVWWVGGGVLNAQTKSADVRPVYQYVGVEQTIARIELATGNVELLVQRGNPKGSLLMDHQRPWEWREVRVRDRSREDAPRISP